jgi:hypothetical protein
MEAGVALLTRRAIPVGLRTFDANHVPRAPMRGLLLEPLAGEDATVGHTILAPHLFDRHANEVEVMRPADPFAAVPEPTVEVLKEPRILERGIAYLQIMLEPGAAGDHADPAAAAANDDLVLAAGSEN